MTPDAAGIEAALAAGLAAHPGLNSVANGRSVTTSCTGLECDWSIDHGLFEPGWELHRAHVAAALLPVVTQAQAEALRLVRQVEADMAERALAAWRSADARRGLSDHAALEVHADALTRWSERFRMAFDGEDYRARADESGA